MSQVNTVKVKQLQEAAAANLSPPPPAVADSFDPYSRDATSRPAPGKPRRTLDDMRKLSEEIKKSRQR